MTRHAPTLPPAPLARPRPLRPRPRVAGSAALAGALAAALLATGCGPGAGPSSAGTPPVEIRTEALPSGRTGLPYAAALEARGPQDGWRWRVVGGRLPEGVRLDAEAGALGGWPRRAGRHRFELEVREGEDRDLARDVTFASARRRFDLLVEPGPLTLLPEPLPAAAFARPYRHRTEAAGGTPPYVFDLPGGASLEGLTLASDGTWRGLPRAPAGEHAVTVRVRDAAGGEAVATYTLRLVVAPLVLATREFPDAALGFPYEATPWLSPRGGGAPYRFGPAAGAPPWPPGLALDPDTGRLHGVPAQAGLYVVRLVVSDAAGQVAQGEASLRVNPGPVLTRVLPGTYRDDGRPLVLEGQGFQPGMEVAIGLAPARPAEVEDATRARLEPPTAAGGTGAVDVTVRNPDGGFHVLARGFRFPLATVSFEDGGVQGTALSASRGIAAGDLDGDGRDDLAHVGSTGIETIHPPAPGGSGSWRTTSVRTSGSYADVGLADLDGDGDLDLVTLRSSATETIETYRNDGAGGFPSTATWSQTYPKPAPHAPFGLALGDVDADGVPDLAFTSGSGNQAWVWVYRGLGDGSFAHLHTSAGTVWDETGGCFAPNAVALADLDGDGRDDLVVTDAFPSACAPGSSCPSTDGRENPHPGRADVVAWIALAQPSGEPGAWRAAILSSGQGALDGDNTGVAAYDHDGDGRLDLAVVGGFRDVRGTGIAFLAGDGRGGVAERFLRATTVNRRFVARLDANQDGADDLVVVGGDGRAGSFGAQGVSVAEVYLGGTREVPVLAWRTGGEDVEGLPGANPGRVVAGDFDGDGREDFAVDQSFHAKERFANDQDDGWIEGVRVFLNRSR